MSNSLDRAVPPIYSDLSSFVLSLKPDLKHHKLDNGTSVYLIEGGTQEVITMQMVFNVGTIYYKNVCIPEATNALLLNGTNRYKHKAITEMFENEGIFVEVDCGKKHSSIQVKCLTKSFVKCLPVLCEILTEANFEEEEIEIFKKNAILNLTKELDKSNFHANRNIRQTLYGSEHPYGSFSTIQQYNDLNQVDILECYEQYYKIGKCTIFVSGFVGQVNLNELNQTIGKLSLNNYFSTTPRLEKPNYKSEKKTINISNKVHQSSIRIGRPIVNIFHDDHYKLRILNNLLGGYFDSRLNRTIREEKGYTYGIDSHIFNAVDLSSLIISAEINQATVADCIEEVKKEFLRLQNTLIDIDELKAVQNYLLGKFLNELDGVFNVALIWQNYLLNEIPIEFFHRSVNNIKKITPEDIKAMAKKYLNYNDFCELIVN
ncbi:MAG: pitrilysin family protein [Sediminibacterium sp.]|nr:pitrilysin family protein [Sediminibacterium sp.]